MDGTTKLSKQALEGVEQELSVLKGPRREAVRQAILDARSMGSIVENGDYTAAKEEERLLEDRIMQLEHAIKTAEIVEHSGGGHVQHGSKVSVLFEDGEEETFLFGDSLERSSLPVCTPASPLGSALSGAQRGDRVAYRTPSGRTIQVTVVDVM